MPHDISLITTIAAALGLALLMGFIAARLKIPPLVGYLIAGIIIGPATPGFVADVALTGQLAEIGVMLLMHGGVDDFSHPQLLPGHAGGLSHHGRNRARPLLPSAKQAQTRQEPFMKQDACCAPVATIKIESVDPTACCK
jgi:hypothetical protein